MNQKITILTKGDQHEAWGSISEICKVKGYSYSYLKGRKFPFFYRGVSFKKVDFRKENGIK